MVCKIHKQIILVRHSVRKREVDKSRKIKSYCMLFYIEYILTNSYLYSELIKDKLYIEIKSLPCPNTTIQECTNKCTNGVSQWGIPYFKVIRKKIEKKGKLFSLRRLKKTLFSSLHEQKVQKWRVI